MLLGFSPSATSEQPGVLSLGGFFGQLIESEAPSTGSGDSGSGGLGKLQGADVHLGDGHKSLIVQDVSDNYHGLICFIFIFVSQFNKSGDGNGVSICIGLVQSLVYDLIEFGVGSSGQERV